MSQPTYDTSYPPSLWGGGQPPVVPATGATAGTPGSFTPPGSTPPANVAGMVGIIASPTTPWTSGQYVQTGTAGVAGRTTWTGSAWVGGVAPLQASEVAAMTVAQAEQFITDHPELRDTVYDLEAAGKARPTLLAWLKPPPEES